jgi:hypothetical protein
MRRYLEFGAIVVFTVLVGSPAAAAAPAQSGRSAGYETSAAALRGWGEPNRVDEFDGQLGAGWNVYDGPGHAGNGRRTPDAVTIDSGILTITGDSKGSTAGMAWSPGQRYGRWEGRVKAPASDESYNALLLLWPDAEDFPVGGEIDFMEMLDHTRQKTDIVLHYGKNNDQVDGEVKIDATQWHNWAVEWTPTHVAAFVDGKEWWRTTDVNILPPRAMHLCIQLDWFPEDGAGAVQESYMHVDWVKQYSIDVGDVVAGTAEDALRTVEQPLGGVAEGVGDLAGGVLGGVGAPLTEGSPDPVPARRGLVDRAVRAGS